MWIIAAAGVFLLVVVGAALILYSPSLQKAKPVQTLYNPADGWISANPSSDTNPALADASNANPYQNPAELTSSSDPLAITSDATNGESLSGQNDQPGMMNPYSNANAPVKADSVTVISDNTTVYGGSTTTIDLNALKNGQAVASTNTVTPQNSLTENRISENTKSSESYSESSYYAPVATSKSVAEKTVAKAETVKKAEPKPAKTVAESKPAPKAKAAPAIPDRFWVQAASYSSEKSAEEARSVLESNKIQSEIFTFKDNKGKLFYRVRIGPYTTASEAEYWNKRIAMIDKFSDANSYVVNSSAKAVR